MLWSIAGSGTALQISFINKLIMKYMGVRLLWTSNNPLCVCVRMVLALLIGFLITAFLRLSNSISGRLVARVYLEAIPEHTPCWFRYQFLFCFTTHTGINNPLWTGILCFFEGSFASEIMRGGIVSVDKGQWEASNDRFGSLENLSLHCLLPQAIPIMLPLTGILVNLIKHSAILSFVAVFS